MNTKSRDTNLKKWQHKKSCDTNKKSCDSSTKSQIYISSFTFALRLFVFVLWILNLTLQGLRNKSLQTEINPWLRIFLIIREPIILYVEKNNRCWTDPPDNESAQPDGAEAPPLERPTHQSNDRKTKSKLFSCKQTHRSKKNQTGTRRRKCSAVWRRVPSGSHRSADHLQDAV